MKKKLLFVVETVGGGVRKHVLQLIDGLDPDLFEIHLIYGPRFDLVFAARREELAKRIDLIYMPELVRSISPKQDLAAIAKTCKIIRRLKPDIVHCHSSKGGIIGRIAAKLEYVPKVFYTPHAYAFDAPEFSAKKRQLFVLIERWASRLATTRTFNVSEGEFHNALAHHIDKPEKFTVIANGLPDVPLLTRNESRTALGLDGIVPKDAPVVGVAAWLIERKGAMTFMEITKRVVAERTNVHFVYVGEGDLAEKARQFVESNGLESNVHLLPYRKDAALLVPAFDVYLLASLYEGMPYSLVEALRAGVQIAATKTTGNDEVVIPGVNGELFPVGDAEQGAQTVNRLLDHPLDHEQVRKTFLERYTEEMMLQRITEQYCA